MKLHILSPSDTSGKNAYLWQDYWVKVELENEFRKLGYEIVNSNAHVDIFLFGTWSPHERFLSAPHKFMWFISHANLLSEKKWNTFHRQFKHIWLVSKTLEQRMYASPLSDIPISVLMGGTAKTYIKPNKEPEYDIVLMGNTSKPRRLKLMKELIAQDKYRIMIAGGGWNKRLTQEELGKITYTPYFPNEKYSEFYNNGKVTFFAGHPDMLEYGMIPPRIYDIYACSDCLCICELNAGLKPISSYISNFKYDDEFLWKVHYYVNNREESLILSNGARVGVMNFTMKHVAKNMDMDIKQCRT